MTNSATIASLKANPVPPDVQCVLPQATANAIAQYVVVQGIASQISSGGTFGNTPITNNTGAQALALAQSLVPRVETLEGNATNRRVPVRLRAIPSGNSSLILSWTPSFPTTSYEVRVHFDGPGGNVAAFTWRVKAGTRTTTSVEVIFDNVPSNDFLVTAVVEYLPEVDQSA